MNGIIPKEILFAESLFANSPEYENELLLKLKKHNDTPENLIIIKWFYFLIICEIAYLILFWSRSYDYQIDKIYLNMVIT